MSPERRVVVVLEPRMRAAGVQQQAIVPGPGQQAFGLVRKGCDMVTIKRIAVLGSGHFGHEFDLDPVDFRKRSLAYRVGVRLMRRAGPFPTLNPGNRP